MFGPTVRPSRMATSSANFTSLDVADEKSMDVPMTLTRENKWKKMTIHALGGSTAALTAAAFLDGSRFGWHPTLMSLSFAFAMGQGIQLAVDGTSLPPGDRRLWNLVMHAWIMAAAIACSALGAYAIYSNKSLHGKPHFSTLHAKFGVVTLCFSLLAPLMGVVAFKKLQVYDKLPSCLQTRVKWLHRNAGRTTFFLAALTSLLGLSTASVYKGWATFVIMGLVVINCAAVGNYTLNKFSPLP